MTQEQIIARVILVFFGALGFVVVVWWRRRSRGESLQLSKSSQRLNQMVKESDATDAETAAEVLSDAIVKGKIGL